jgi:hypothetical protein
MASQQTNPNNRNQEASTVDICPLIFASSLASVKEALFRKANRSLRIVPVDLSVNAPPVSIAMLKNRTASPVAKLFIACLRSLAKQEK